MIVDNNDDNAHNNDHNDDLKSRNDSEQWKHR